MGRNDFMENKAQMKKKKAVFAGYAVIFLLLVIFDQWSKHQAVLFLKGQTDIPLIKGVFELSYLENTGMAWGLFAGARWGFLIFRRTKSLMLQSMIRKWTPA